MSYKTVKFQPVSDVTQDMFDRDFLSAGNSFVRCPARDVPYALGSLREMDRGAEIYAPLNSTVFREVVTTDGKKVVLVNPNSEKRDLVASNPLIAPRTWTDEKVWFLTDVAPEELEKATRICVYEGKPFVDLTAEGLVKSGIRSANSGHLEASLSQPALGL